MKFVNRFDWWFSTDLYIFECPNHDLMVFYKISVCESVWNSVKLLVILTGCMWQKFCECAIPSFNAGNLIVLKFS